MSPGKLAAQAGHAFVAALARASPGRVAEYCNGTKVVLGARTLDELMEVYERASYEGLPCSLIEDSGHVMPPHFDGSPIITAVGIGPVLRHESHHITRKLNLVR